MHAQARELVSREGERGRKSQADTMLSVEPSGGETDENEQKQDHDMS